MESIKSMDEIGNIKDNEVFGNFDLINTEIKFYGVNNILFCEENIVLKNSNISFLGNNSIIYLSYTQHGDYNMEIIVRNDSAIFIGRDNNFGTNVQINIQEHQNLIIGDDGIIGNNVNIRTYDTFPIYDSITKNRVNHSESVFIGDHVWLDHFTYVSRGVKIGSGAIVGIHSLIPACQIIKSNTNLCGNPVQVMANNVFFTKEFTGTFNAEDTINYSSYKSDVFIYSQASGETLNLNKIDEIIKDLTVSEKLEFIQKLFIRNKRRNRFSI